MNHILIETKFYIYKCSLNDELPIYRRLKYRLNITEEIERKNCAQKKQDTTTYTQMESSHKPPYRIKKTKC